MKFIDDKNKQLKWYNRNYFFAGTIFLIALMTILFFAVGSRYSWQDPLQNNANSILVNINNFFNMALNTLFHVDVWHLVGNMLQLLFAGLYIERRHGTLKFLLLNVLFMFTINGIAAYLWNDVNGIGYSGVYFALDAFVIIDYIFSFRKSERNLTNIILGAIVIVLIYVFSMCWIGGGLLDITYWPKNLLDNSAHFAGFFWGLLFSLFYQTESLIIKKQSKEN